MAQLQTPPPFRMSGMPCWKPASGMVDHRGQPLANDADFFSPPPPQISEVKSACTSLAAGKEPMGLPMRAVLFLLSAMPGLVIAYIGMVANGRGFDAEVMIFSMILIAARNFYRLLIHPLSCQTMLFLHGRGRLVARRYRLRGLRHRPSIATDLPLSRLRRAAHRTDPAFHQWHLYRHELCVRLDQCRRPKSLPAQRQAQLQSGHP